MANQRPIRRGRIPFRRRARRPASWHDALSTSTLGQPGKPWAPLNNVAAGIPTLTMRELLVGNVDAQYLDREEVRVDRIVGDLSFYAWRQYSDHTAYVGDVPPVVRWGLVVEEDPKDEDFATTTPTVGNSRYSLWDAGDLAQTEWMYLSEPHLQRDSAFWEGTDTNIVATWRSHEHVDIRVKRKLGKADRLWLVMTHANGVEGGAAADWPQIVYESHMLRAVLVA